MEQHADNLKFPQLDRQQIKDDLVAHEIIAYQQKERALYHDVLHNLQPKQIATLLEKNYKKEGKFLSFPQIPKDYAYYFLVQTSLAMLGYNCSIDGYYGKNYDQTLRNFQQDHGLAVDGDTGPLVLDALTSQLTMLGSDPIPLVPVIPHAPVQSIPSAPQHLEAPVIAARSPSPTEYNQLTKEKNQRARSNACFRYLHQKLGFTPIQAAGIVGNIAVESRFSTKARGDRGQSHGLCQWRDERFTALKSFASQQGSTVDNYQTQLAFIKYELEHTEKATARALAKATTIAEATESFLRTYERSRVRNTQGRVADAHLAYNNYQSEKVV